MVRSILAVIVSYIVMFILIAGVFAAMWFGMGPDRLLQPGSWKGNMFLCIAAPAITVLGGLFGGWMCRKMGRGRNPVIALAVVVLVLGLTGAYFTLKKPEPTGARDPGLTMTQIMEQGREPTWIALFNPIGGAASVLVGGLLLAGPRKPRS